MKRIKWLLRFGLLGFVVLLLVPQQLQMPVDGATSSDYNPKSFWHYPWGKSVTHKGVDIFAASGTTLHSATSGFVVAKGNNAVAGNYVLVLGPKWRLHYYAHLQRIAVKTGNYVNQQTKLGTVGNTGNAAGKPTHLHYTIMTLVPYPWRIDTGPHGWRKMFYLDPTGYF